MGNYNRLLSGAATQPERLPQADAEEWEALQAEISLERDAIEAQDIEEQQISTLDY